MKGEELRDVGCVREEECIDSSAVCATLQNIDLAKDILSIRDDNGF